MKSSNLNSNRGNTAIYIMIAVIIIALVGGGAYFALNYKKLFPPKFTTQEPKKPEIVTITKEDAQAYVDYYAQFQKLDISVVTDIESLYTKDKSGKYIVNPDKTKILAKIKQSQTDIEKLDLPSINQDEIKNCLSSRKSYIENIEADIKLIETTNKINEKGFEILGNFIKNCKVLNTKQIEAQVIIKGEK